MKLHCNECPKWPEERRKLHGCVGKTETPLFEFEGEKIYQCVGRLVTEDTKSFLRIYNMCKLFEKLPLAGGVLDQPVFFMEAATLIESTVQEIEKEKNE